MPLTVAQILPALEVGGVERGTLEIAAALVKRGHRSIVISAGGRLVKKLVDGGSEHITLPIGKKSLFTLRYVRTLRDILGKENVSIIHARSRLPAWIGYLAWRSMNKEQRPHFVTTVHGPYSVNPYSSIMMRGERIIAISEFIQDYIISNYPNVDAGKITVIHRGVSPEEFPYKHQPRADWLASWRQQHPALKNKFIITLPARITRWKGQEDFIEIVRLALARNLPVHGLIAGAAHPRRASFYNELLSLINKYGIKEHITFLGHRDDLKEILAVSGVALSLAREPEAFGRTALEALCLGIPVIAYDHGGAAEVLREIFPVGLVEPFAIDAVSIKLEEFFKARPRVPDHNPYTLEQMQNQTLHLYENLF